MVGTFFHFARDVETCRYYEIGICFTYTGPELARVKWGALGVKAGDVYACCCYSLLSATQSPSQSMHHYYQQIPKGRTVIQIDPDVSVLFREQDFQVPIMIMIELTPRKLPMQSTH
jgi:hypothetical protein